MRPAAYARLYNAAVML